MVLAPAVALPLTLPTQNHVGIERMIENLSWNGEMGFGVSSAPSAGDEASLTDIVLYQNVSALDWRVDGKHAGTWTTSRGLTYVKIADASHMASS